MARLQAGPVIELMMRDDNAIDQWFVDVTRMLRLFSLPEETTRSFNGSVGFSKAQLGRGDAITLDIIVCSLFSPNSIFAGTVSNFTIGSSIAGRNFRSSSRRSSSLCFPSTFLLSVALVVELVEEEEEHHSVKSDPPDKGLRVVAVYEEKLERVNHDKYELQHLEGS